MDWGVDKLDKLVTQVGYTILDHTRSEERAGAFDSNLDAAINTGAILANHI